jgi:predicted DNA-binding protein
VLTPELEKKLRAKAEREGCTVSASVMMAIERYVKDE